MTNLLLFIAGCLVGILLRHAFEIGLNHWRERRGAHIISALFRYEKTVRIYLFRNSHRMEVLIRDEKTGDLVAGFGRNRSQNFIHLIDTDKYGYPMDDIIHDSDDAICARDTKLWKQGPNPP